MSTLPSSGESKDAMIEMACVSECCFGTLDSSDNSCSEEEKQEGGCCADGICNPFVTCKVCLGYVTAEFDYSILPQKEENSLFNIVNESIPDVYISDCWQPPELS
jgi:hypothetical protein